jgi:hypothetical protein
MFDKCQFVVASDASVNLTKRTIRTLTDAYGAGVQG